MDRKLFGTHWLKAGVLALGLVMAIAMAPATASAIDIDFTDGAWNPNPPAGATTKTVNVAGIDVTVSGFNNGNPHALYWDNVDGFGVKNGEDDEIDNLELLTVDFAVPVFLNEIYLTDLFTEPGDQGWQEQGAYSTDGGITWNWFMAPLGNLPSPVTNGEYEITVNLGGITNLAFKALYPVPQGQNHDFSVAGVEINEEPDPDVPEPGTMLLFGSAAGAIGWIRRRMKK